MTFHSHVEQLVDLLRTVDCCMRAMEAEDAVLKPATGARLFEALIDVLLRQVDGTLAVKTTLPWLLFYKALVLEEARAGDDADIPHSANFLVSAHDYTGQMSLCTEGGGELLLTMVAALAPLVRKASLGAYVVESVKKNLDQALYCLYCHPSKKSKARYLVDHGVSSLALTWNRCSLLFDVVRPQKVPEFDDYKALSITSDTEALLRRFVALVPDEFNLEERSLKVRAYLGGDDDDDDGKAASKSFPTFPDNAAFPKDMLDTFYLLADFYFKNSQFAVAVPFYMKDLSFNPWRLDSLVAMALSQANQVEDKLGGNDPADFRAIAREARGVLNCFRESLRKDASNVTINIEGANFAYAMHAYCSRLIKSAANHFSMEEFAAVERRKAEYLAFADESYTSALRLLDETLDPDGPDERWLLHFMRGKIREKDVADDGLIPCLREYVASVKNLLGQGAFLPRKISFGPGTPELSLELLEVYYRMHASILKLELASGFKETDELVRSLSGLLREVGELGDLRADGDVVRQEGGQQQQRLGVGAAAGEAGPARRGGEAAAVEVGGHRRRVRAGAGEGQEHVRAPLQGAARPQPLLPHHGAPAGRAARQGVPPAGRQRRQAANALRRAQDGQPVQRHLALAHRRVRASRQLPGARGQVPDGAVRRTPPGPRTTPSSSRPPSC